MRMSAEKVLSTFLLPAFRSGSYRVPTEKLHSFLSGFLQIKQKETYTSSSELVPNKTETHPPLVCRHKTYTEGKQGLREHRLSTVLAQTYSSLQRDSPSFVFYEVDGKSMKKSNVGAQISSLSSPIFNRQVYEPVPLTPFVLKATIPIVTHQKNENKKMRKIATGSLNLFFVYMDVVFLFIRSQKVVFLL